MRKSAARRKTGTAATPPSRISDYPLCRLMQRGVQVLQRIDFEAAATAQVLQAFDGRPGTGDGGKESQARLQGIGADGARVGNGVAALFDGVDDQGDFLVLDHVDDVRTAFGYLVDHLHLEAG